MALPETIPVRYTEEEAGYVSFRPLVQADIQLERTAGHGPQRDRQGA